MRLFYRLSALIFLFLFAAVPVRAADGVLVFAAASLTDALGDIGKDYAATGHPAPKFSFAASSALARQIENGAPASIFISADEDWMNYVADKKLIDPASRTVLLGNHLVLIAPKDQPQHLTIAPKFPLLKALGDEKLAMGDTDSVPAGKYGRAALLKLGVWDQVAPNVIRLDSVRAALAMVERREAVLGIVYRTDALASWKVMIAGEFPDDTHAPIVYPLAVIKENATPEAIAFAAYLKSDAAKAVFRKFGFEVP